MTVTEETMIHDFDPAAKAFTNHMKVLDNAFFDGHAGDEGTGPRLLVMLDRDMPTSEDGFNTLLERGVKGLQADTKRMTVNAYVMNCLTAGYSKVPIEAQGSKYVVSKDAKELSTICRDEEIGEGFQQIECFPWTIVPGQPKDKDERKEDPELTWKLRTGMCIRFTLWRDQLPGSAGKEAKPDMFPKDVDILPAFSLVVMNVQIKGWSSIVEGETVTLMNGKTKTMTDKDVCPVKKGYGIAPSKFSTVNGSLYSILDKIPKCLASSYFEIQDKAKSFVDMYAPISQCLQTTQLPFVVEDVSRESTFAIQDDLVKIFEWSLGETDPIDVTVADVLRYTNCTTIRSAMCLLELACKSGCLTLVVFQDRYRVDRKDETPKFSIYYGVPLIHTKKLLACCQVETPAALVEQGNYYKFTGQPTVEYSPDVYVSKELVPALAPADKKPSCPDMILSGVGVEAEKAYFVKFVRPGADDKPLWNGYFRVEKPQVLIGSGKGSIVGNAAAAVRKHFMEDEGDEAFDPFAATQPAVAPPEPVKKKIKKNVEG